MVLDIEERISLTADQASLVTGYSAYVINSAIRSGDLRTVQPEVNGRRLGKRVIMRDDLVAWLRGEVS